MKPSKTKQSVLGFAAVNKEQYDQQLECDAAVGIAIAERDAAVRKKAAN